MRYRFKGFEIDTLQFKLFSVGKSLALEPKVFDLLVCLLKKRHRVVTREELFDTVWQRQVVADTTLSNHINSTCKILGDNGIEQFVIATSSHLVEKVSSLPSARCSNFVAMLQKMLRKT